MRSSIGIVLTLTCNSQLAAICGSLKQYGTILVLSIFSGLTFTQRHQSYNYKLYLSWVVMEGIADYYPEAVFSDNRMEEIPMPKSGFGDMVLAEIHAKMENRQSTAYGTGLIIDQRFVLTAAHLIYCTKLRRQFKDITVTFFRQGRRVQMQVKSRLILSPKIKEATATLLEFIQNDYGILQIEPVIQSYPVGGANEQRVILDQFYARIEKVRNKYNQAMILGFGVNNTRSDVSSPSQVRDIEPNTLKISTGPFSRDGNLIKYRMDTTNGMSGGVILQFINKSIVLIGIHSGSGSNWPPRFNAKGQEVQSPTPRSKTKGEEPTIGFNIGLPIENFEESVKKALQRDYGFVSASIFSFLQLESIVQLKRQQQIKKLVPQILNELERCHNPQNKMKIIQSLIKDDYKKSQLRQAVADLTFQTIDNDLSNRVILAETVEVPRAPKRVNSEVERQRWCPCSIY